jgi:SagB-type dehydrogenase family enzyme
MQEISLPEPRIEGSMSLEEAIAARRSVRSYESSPLSMEEIGQLAWAAQGITGAKSFKRAAPSAGGCCPLELYVCTADGVWRYKPEGHRLVPHLEYDIREQLAEASWGQVFISRAAAVFAASAVLERTTNRYGERGRTRYVSMDVGHMAQNLLLQAVALGLASVPVGAFEDSAVAEVLDLPKDEEILYLLPVGRPAV